MNTSLQETLLKVGMEPTVIKIYLILIENGEMTVPHILEKTQLSRATVYEVLPVLLAQGFLEYRKVGRVAYYKPTHPSKLFSLLEERKREVALLEGEMKESIRSLTGTFNIALSKPGVQYFEGAEGFREALSDTLTSKEEVRTIVDASAVEKYVKDINTAYVKERREKGITKRLLILDTPENRVFMEKQGGDLSDFRFLPKTIRPFQTGMQIYDGKVSYFTLREKNITAVIITDPEIFFLQKEIFEALWNLSEAILSKPPVHSGPSVPPVAPIALPAPETIFSQTPSPSDEDPLDVQSNG